MKKWLFRIVWIPVLVVAVLFLVANRQPVAISLDPFSASNPAVTTAALPLWLWLMTMLFIGVAIGSFGMWLSGSSRRRKNRHDRRELKNLRRTAAAHQKPEESEDVPSQTVEEAPLLEDNSS